MTTPPSAPGDLSPTELEVLSALSRGWTVRETAERLGLPPGRIRAHRQRVARKLGAPTLSELARLALRDRLV